MGNFCDDLLIATNNARGGYFKKTLARHVGEILAEMEKRYGPRNSKFTLLGIEFHETGPRCWFPNACGHVIIQLSASALQSSEQALFQLAHECIHLLDPSVSELSTVFEEGIATKFSCDYSRKENPNYHAKGDAKYEKAADLANKALSIREDVVRCLRWQGVPFFNFKPEELKALCKNLSSDDADSLCARFQTWEPPS